MKRYIISLVLITAAFLTSCSSDKDKRTPLDIATAVADKVLRESAFEFKQVVQEPVLDMQILDYKNGYGFPGDGVYYSLSNVKSNNDTTLTFGISFSGAVKIWINENLEYEGRSDNPAEAKEIAYSLFTFDDSIDVDIKEGLNKILVKLVSLNDEPKVFLREITKEHEQPHTAEFILENTSEEFDLGWLSVGAFPKLKDISATIDFKYPPEEEVKDYYQFGGEIYSWTGNRKNILRELVIEPTNSYKRESYLEWHYANGTVMMGLLAVNELSNNDKYSDFVKKYVEFTLENYDYFKWQHEKLNALRGSNHRIFRSSMLDDTGAPALPVAHLYSINKNESYKQLIDDMDEYVSNEQVRLEDGTFCRPEPVEMTVWADDLFMSVPFLLRMAKITGDSKYYDDAALQVIKFNELLFDESIGLYKHGWFDNIKKISIAHWGRANGWIVWGTSEALLHLPKDHKDYSKILKIFQTHMEGLIKHQGESGMWHQVLNHPNSFEETSCTAMFIMGIARGVKNGWLDEKYKDNAIKAWDAFKKKIKQDGTVIDITRGTGMGYTYEFYYNRQRFAHDPRGLGAVMTAAAEMSELVN